MTCTKAEALIQNSLDGLLSPAERIRLDAHLAHCPACARAWTEFHVLDGATARLLSQNDPGDAFTDQVMAQIAAQSMPARPALGPRWALAATFCAFLVMLSYFLSPWIPGAHFSSALSPATWGIGMIPEWLLGNLRALPSDALNAWEAMPPTEIAPRWLYLALLAAGAVNLTLLRVTQGSRRASL